MEISLKISFPAPAALIKSSFTGNSRFLLLNKGREYIKRVHSVSLNGSIVCSDTNKLDLQLNSRGVGTDLTTLDHFQNAPLTRYEVVADLVAFCELCCEFHEADSRAVVDAHRQRSSLESLFCYDKPIPEEIIEKPVGLSLEERQIGENPPCTDCQAKGAVLCATCSGSGLYIDSIMESQGIIVKVRCLGCGGTGNIMCSDCGGRGHR